MPRPRPKPERRWTLLWVPARGQGPVRQREVGEGELRRAGLAGLSLLLLVGVGVVWAVPERRPPEDAALEAENRALREQLAAVERKVGEMEPLVERVKAFDEQLRELDRRRALPGTGDWEPEAFQARQDWLDGVIGAPAEEQAAALEDRVDDLRDELLALDLTDLGERIGALYETTDVLPQVWPVDGTLTSRFGWRRAPYGDHSWRFHKGIDLGVPFGTPILSSNDGVVTFSGWDSGHGNMVVVDHGEGVASRYCHASVLYAELGDEVYAGDTIALAGSTGVSTGPHLHYELWVDGEPVDPLPYLSALGL